LPGGHVYHQFIGGVVGEGKPTAIQAVAGDDRGESEPFVTVDERVVPGQRVQ
jgi:hypothetical protein